MIGCDIVQLSNGTVHQKSSREEAIEILREIHRLHPSALEDFALYTYCERGPILIEFGKELAKVLSV